MKFWPMCVVVILLTACAPTGISPDEAIADARATQGAAQAQMRSTEKAANRERANATLQAAATQGAAQVEIDLLAARLQATQQAQDMEIERARVTDAALQLQVTQTAAAEIAARTQVAQDLQATTSAMQAVATQTQVALAMVEAQQISRNSQNARTAWFYTLTVGLAVGIVSLIILVILVAWRYLPRLIEALLEWGDRPNRFVETRAGSVVWLNGSPVLVAQLPETGARLTLPRGATENTVTALTRSGSVLASPMEPGITTMTVQFLKASVKVVGGGSQVLPRWDKIGWSSKPTRRVISALEAAGAVQVERGVGTFIADEYQTVGNLLYELEMGKIVLHTPPPASSTDEDV